jgi:hypothetical protein
VAFHTFEQSVVEHHFSVTDLCLITGLSFFSDHSHQTRLCARDIANNIQSIRLYYSRHITTSAASCVCTQHSKRKAKLRRWHASPAARAAPPPTPQKAKKTKPKMGKGGTKFEGEAIGVRAKAKSGLTGKEMRKNMEKFLETGVHPELERQAREAAAEGGSGRVSLPDHDPHRPFVFWDLTIDNRPAGAHEVEMGAGAGRGGRERGGRSPACAGARMLPCADRRR